jgi:hypothetical protein
VPGILNKRIHHDELHWAPVRAAYPPMYDISILWAAAVPSGVLALRSAE